MIITKLLGGLGNQMFQYAAGRTLAAKHNAEFKLDISAYETYKIQDYAINNLNIIENISTTKEIKEFKHKKFLKLIPIKNKKYIKEKEFTYDPDIFYLSDNVYLEGYWQSVKYFQSIENIIRHDFKFKTQPQDKNLELSKIITNTNSISLHIRRGDYITNPVANAVHGLCSLDYYEKSINYIAEKVENPQFFIFSDDAQWAKENLNIPFLTNIIDWNKNENSYEDMRLMSLCKHNIIANSSFSWWGAWLNQNSDKIVIAPEKWFNTSKIDAKDLVPENWIKL